MHEIDILFLCQKCQYLFSSHIVLKQKWYTKVVILVSCLVKVVFLFHN